MTAPSPVPADSAASLRRRLESLAAAYTDDWDADSPDPGTALLAVGARFGSDLRERVNDAPAKHRLAFLDALGVTRRPPTPARTPVTFEVADGADDVTVPAGTTLRTDDGQYFETTEGLTATGASPTDVLAVDPDRNALLDHGAVLDGEAVSLFAGADERRPCLLVGDDYLATVEAGATLVLEAGGQGSPFAPAFDWEIHGSDGATEGWHRLERLDDGEGSGARARFRVPVTPTERPVDDEERHWLRCRPADGTARPELSIGSLSVAVAADRRPPDATVQNDVPVPTEGDVRPFGRHAQPPATWYVASSPAFTAPGGTAEITLEEPTGTGYDDGDPADERPGSDDADVSVRGTPALDGPPAVSWEYYNGTGWARIQGVEDGTDALRTAGTVRFPVPPDLSATTVAGRTEPWVRARLVGGQYGDPLATLARDERGEAVPEDAGSPAESLSAPRFGGVSVTHEQSPLPVDRLRYRVGTEYRSADLDSGPVSPFPGVPADTQTLYLGFDGPLSGTVTLLSVVDWGGQRGTPALDWAYWRDGWRSVEPTEGSARFADGGVVSLSLPDSTAATERFGRRRHWLRAQVAGERVRTDHDTSGANRERAPQLRALHTDAVQAAQVRTVEETHALDGAGSRTVSCSETPVLDPAVWVEESARLAAEDRRALQSTCPDHVRHVTDDRDVTSELWVRWTETETFAGSDADDRHYVLDSVAGTITFGDGEHGMAPPADGAVRVTYERGGGAAGNVDPDSITGLADAVPGVEGVSNPVVATGGTDAESTDAVRDRAADRLRHRCRAVTPGDYERIASALGSVGAACCLPNRSEGAGVTVVVVPAGSEQRADPPAALRERVSAELEAAAPARVSAAGGVSVRGPEYVPVSTAVTVRGDASVRGRIRDRLASLLHPTTGDGGDGWAFGTTPTRDALSRAVEGVEGVRSLRGLDAWVGAEGRRSLDAASIPSKALICSGQHRVTVESGGTDGA